MNRIHPRLALALGIAILLLFASAGLRFGRREMSLWRRAHASETQLRDLIHNLETERRALNVSVNRPAPAPKELAEVYLPGMEVVVTPLSEKELPQGLRHRAVELTFTAVPWEALRNFLDKTEAQSPPWRVTALEIRAGRRHLDGRLRLEALDKTETVD